MKKEIVEVGTVTMAEFLANEKGGKPICRVGNIVCFIDNKFEQFVAPRSVWIVELQNISGTTGTILPVVKIKSAWENLRDIENKIDMFKKEKPERKRKPAVKYSNV